MTKTLAPREIGAINRKRVYDFFVENPCHSNLDASQSLNLSKLAVGKHCKAIREGWRPDQAEVIK